MIQKLILGHQELQREVHRLREFDERVAYFVDETVSALNFSEKEKAKFQTFIEENASLLNSRFNPRDSGQSELRTQLESLWKNPYGHLGEMMAALHFPGVEVLNLHLRTQNNNAIGPRVNFHRNQLVEAIDRSFERIEESSPEALQSWKSRFPLIFTDGRMENPTDFSKVKQWLQSKEIDLVTKAKEGKFYLLEVKNYTQLMDQEGLHSSYKGKKTVWEQQIEMKQIIEFLELDGTYTPAITFLNGIDEAATREFEQAGIMVIPYR